AKKASRHGPADGQTSSTPQDSTIWTSLTVQHRVGGVARLKVAVVATRAVRMPVPSTSIRHPQHRLDRRSLGGVQGGPIDLRKRVEGHHPLDRHLVLHEKIDQLGDELLRVAFALDHASHHTAELKERHLEGWMAPLRHLSAKLL